MGRRAERRKKNKRKKAIQLGIAIFILTIIIYITHGVYEESKIRLAQQYEVEQIDLGEEIEKNEKIEKEERKKGVKVPKEYLGYKVDAYLEIPKLNLKTEVLSNYSEEGMEVCVSKYWGPNPNEIGNYCIAGHNYITDKMFSRLKKLTIGEKIILSDNKNGKYTYIIYDIYKAEPDNTESLSQNTNEEREITLITCNNYSKNRLIVKAKEEK